MVMTAPKSPGSIGSVACGVMHTPVPGAVLGLPHGIDVAALAEAWFPGAVWERAPVTAAQAQRRARPMAGARFRGVTQDVAAEPGVELVGSVADLQAELSRADVSIVPIRVGAGTRLKVVEALANRLPLVTTTVGCEGIDVVDGVHALVADDAADFAAACVRLAGDGELRQRLADAGHELFAGRYDWDRIESDVAALATEVVSSGGRG